MYEMIISCQSINQKGRVGNHIFSHLEALTRTFKASAEVINNSEILSSDTTSTIGVIYVIRLA